MRVSPETSRAVCRKYNKTVYSRIFEKNEMGLACGSYGGGEGAYRVLVGKPEEKRPLGRPRRKWVDNIRI